MNKDMCACNRGHQCYGGHSHSVMKVRLETSPSPAQNPTDDDAASELVAFITSAIKNAIGTKVNGDCPAPTARAETAHNMPTDESLQTTQSTPSKSMSATESMTQTISQMIKGALSPKRNQAKKSQLLKWFLSSKYKKMSVYEKFLNSTRLNSAPEESIPPSKRNSLAAEDVTTQDVPPPLEEIIEEESPRSIGLSPSCEDDSFMDDQMTFTDDAQGDNGDDAEDDLSASTSDTSQDSSEASDAGSLWTPPDDSTSDEESLASPLSVATVRRSAESVIIVKDIESTVKLHVGQDVFVDGKMSQQANIISFVHGDPLKAYVSYWSWKGSWPNDIVDCSKLEPVIKTNCRTTRPRESDEDDSSDDDSLLLGDFQPTFSR